MAYLKDIKNEIDQVGSLRDLTKVYGEIASSRMKKIRGHVLRNRQFLQSISDIFNETLKAYSAKLREYVKSGKVKKGGKVTFLAHNGKAVAVLISANTGFYGDVIKNTFEKFIEEIGKDKNLEVTIIGRVGRSLFTSREPERPFVYFELPDFGVDLSKTNEVIKHLVQYEEIQVFYGKFHSVVTQLPEVQNIIAGAPVGESSSSGVNIAYIFEPSIEDILMFFETQIFASLFDQSIRESQLAKFASRILAMDRANINIEERVKKLKHKKMTLMHKLSNTKQLNSLSSIVYR